MTKLTNLLPLLLAAVSAFGQKPADAVWTQFEKRTKTGSIFGYKDATGYIRIPAKFGAFSRALKFRHIVAVNEEATQRYYYLLKTGRQVGRDSVYMFDYTFDCESEGKIRFESRAKNRVGFLNGQGRVVIPAVYNYVTPFHNGLAVGLVGAHAKCFSGEKDTIACEHPGWVDGQRVLINERNEVLLTFPAKFPWQRLDLYSVSINAAVAPDTATTVTLRAVSGDRYSFIDYEKEFANWFYQVFVPAVRSGKAANVLPLCYAELAASARPFKGWLQVDRATFVQKFYESELRPKLGGLQRGAPNVDISTDDLNTLIFTSQNFQRFLTDCGEHAQDKYPAFVVVLTFPSQVKPPKNTYQSHFEFIRTDKGYRLFCMAL